MEISNNFNRYDSAVNRNSSVNQSGQISRTNSIKEFLQAFKVDISQRALNSSEANDPNNKFPLHNTDILQYSENLDLTYKS